MRALYLACVFFLAVVPAAVAETDPMKKGFWFGPGTTATYDKRPLGLRPSTGDDLANRFSSAYAAAVMDGTISTKSVYVESFYRSGEYQKKLTGTENPNSPHQRWLAIDYSLAGVSPGRMEDWFLHLADQGLYSPYAWDTNHIEPMPGTPLFDVAAEANQSTVRLSYSGQVDRLIQMRTKILMDDDNYDLLRDLVDFFPAAMPETERDALGVIARFRADTYVALKDRATFTEMLELETSVGAETLPAIFPGNTRNLVQEFAPLESVTFSMPTDWWYEGVKYPSLYDASKPTIWKLWQLSDVAQKQAEKEANQKGDGDEDEPIYPDETKPKLGGEGSGGGSSGGGGSDDTGDGGEDGGGVEDECTFAKRPGTAC